MVSQDSSSTSQQFGMNRVVMRRYGLILREAGARLSKKPLSTPSRPTEASFDPKKQNIRETQSWKRYFLIQSEIRKNKMKKRYRQNVPMVLKTLLDRPEPQKDPYFN